MLEGLPRRCYVNRYERAIVGAFFALITLYFTIAAIGARDRQALAVVAVLAALVSAGVLARLVTSMVVLREERSFLIRGTCVSLRVPDGSGSSAEVVDRYVGVFRRAGLVVTMPDGSVRDMGRWGIYAPRRQGPRRARLEHVAELINQCARRAGPAVGP